MEAICKHLAEVSKGVYTFDWNSPDDTWKPACQELYALGVGAKSRAFRGTPSQARMGIQPLVGRP